MRILTLGLNNSGKSAIINRLKFNETIETEPTQGFNVTAVDFNSNRFTLWEVGGDNENRNTFKQHTNNTNGMIYVVDVSSPDTFEQSKQQLELALNDRQLQGAPLLIFANKVDQGGNLQQVIDELGLNQVNDREWYIQGSNGISGVGVNQGFDWLTKNLLSKSNKNYTFDAQPKVVKSQAKYKPQNEQEFISESQRTFVKLIKDPRVITMDPIDQENEYIRLEKERITYENMKEQLKNFKKNKNKQTPYEIKPSPNPRIEVNLEFFLTDHNNLIVPQTKDVNEQTDTFSERPKSPPYVPKKTGIDAQTQVEDFELFVFDREVTPIVDVVVSKICEQALLEIEQEKELQKMREYKRQFQERREEDMEKQRDILTKEVELIQQKNERLYKYSEKEYRVRATLRRTQAYAIAGQFLQNMQKNTFEQIYKHGIYQNTLEQKLKANFIPWLVEETCKNYLQQQDMSQKMLGLFDDYCINPILEKQQPVLEMRKKKKARVDLRRVNERKQQKYIRIFYNQVHLRQSNFVKNFARFSEGTLEDYQIQYAARVQELKDKIEIGDIQEEEYQKVLDEEFPDNIGWGFQVSAIKKLAFTLAHNQYYKTLESQKNMQLLAYCLSADSEIQFAINKQNLRPQTDNPKTNKFIRYKTNVRDPYRRIDNDEAIIVDFDKIPENVQTIFIFTQIQNLQNIAAAQQEAIPYAQFGVEDWKYNIGIDNVQVSDIAKLEEIVKPVDQGQEEQSAYIFSYVLTKQQNEKWIIESIKQTKAFYDHPPPPAEDQENEDNQRNQINKQNNQNEELQKQTEMEQYVDLIREFWGKQSGTLKNEKILTENQDDGENQPQEAENEDEGENLENLLGQPRITGQFLLDLKDYQKSAIKSENDETEAMQNLQLFLEQQIEVLDPEFVSSCTNGYTFYYRDQPLEKIKQIRKIKNAQDLEVRANPPPPPEPEFNEGEEGEEGQDQDGEQEDQD